MYANAYDIEAWVFEKEEVRRLLPIIAGMSVSFVDCTNLPCELSLLTD